ncbi:lipopolysaccharide biosynthesis protein [Pedobacter africanus]|uniref:Membrane protein involved in the export of O-antigen and teichoic acid n=1 Tax=Pedobacter africanus TaxID=151894 RepID=A0A1W2BS68_9SPHI|nr:lipopolysaccharide biosynthesis protein [Pedobacter africanus]SMC75835.1 Membrane protein involved in the export of O-antigen and teichoic acid [Pedobacter africanus]
MGLQKATISGLIWTLAQQFSVQIIYFITQIILARLLSPSAFGLIAMLQIFISIGQILIDNGMATSLIRTQNVDERDYSTVFIINMVSSVLIYMIIFILAPFIASFYNLSELTLIVRVYTLSFIIQALVGVQTTQLTKAMNFKLQMLMQVPSAIIGGISGIILAIMGYGVWSLVWMALIRTFVFMVQHWFYTDWRPKLMFDKLKLKYHFGFGYKLTLSGVLDVIYTNSYNLIIGKLFSTTQLGYYNQADTLRMFPVNNISMALNKVTYPMFASINNDDEKLKIAYKKLMTQILFWIVPFMLLLIVIARPLFIFLIGEKWEPAVPYFRILCIAAIVYPLHIYNLNIINVKGRSDLFLRLEVIKKIVGLSVIGISLFFGMPGLLIGQVLFSFGAVYINTYYSGKMINYSLKEQMKDIYPIFLIAVFTLVITWGGYLILGNYFRLANLLQVVLVGTVFFATYIGVCFLYKVPALQDFKNIVSNKPLLP